MGDLLKLQEELKRYKNEIDSVILPRARELQQMYHEEVLRPLIRASNGIENAVALTIAPVIEEIDAEGGGVTGRARRTRVEQPDEEGVEKKEKGKAAPPKLPKGKRACSKCRNTGHRATTCPN